MLVAFETIIPIVKRGFLLYCHLVGITPFLFLKVILHPIQFFFSRVWRSALNLSGLECMAKSPLHSPSLSPPKRRVSHASIQVHLDTDLLLSPDDFVGLAPMSVLCARLCSVLNPGVEMLDNPGANGDSRVAWTSETSDTIGSYFREFMSELLQVMG